jgi:hypothetical protein
MAEVKAQWRPIFTVGTPPSLPSTLNLVYETQRIREAYSIFAADCWNDWTLEGLRLRPR